MDFGFENLEPSFTRGELFLPQSGNIDFLFQTYLEDMSSFSGKQGQSPANRGLLDPYQAAAGYGGPSSSSSSGSYDTTACSFARIPIADWQGEDCIDWANSVCKKRGIDTASISAWDFRNSTGAVLKQFLPQHFSTFVGEQYGEIFFQELQALRKKNNGKKKSKTASSASSYGPAPALSSSSSSFGAYQGSEDYLDYTTEDLEDFSQYFPDTDSDSLSCDLQDLELHEQFMPIQYEEEPNNYEPLPLPAAVPSALDTASGSSSTGSITDTEHVFKKIPTNTRRKERGPRSWEFLVRLLADKRTNPAIIKWENEAAATFRLTQPSIIAQLWGKRSNNPNLSYINFARGLRYHYQTGGLVSVSERQLVYGLGPKGLEYLELLKKESQ